MDTQKDSWSGAMASNQGQSSNIDPTLKSAVLIPATENQQGAESTLSTTAGFGAPTGIMSTDVNYSIKDVNTFNAELPAYLNGTASTEDLSAKWQNRTQDVPPAGQNQYES